MIGNKISDRITGTASQSAAETTPSKKITFLQTENTTKILLEIQKKKIFIPPGKRQQVIDELRLI